VTANAIALPIQHRLVEVSPTTAGVALSWYSTALYAGIACAPLLGSAALGLGRPELIPLLGAGAALFALVAFLLGFVRSRVSLAATTA